MLGRFAVQNKSQRMGATVQLRLKSFLWRWLLALQSPGSRARGLQQLQLPGSTAQVQ